MLSVVPPISFLDVYSPKFTWTGSMLTDTQCRNATCPLGKKRARFADAGGLYLEVSVSGSKRWFWKYRKEGKETRLALGKYPLVSLAEARQKRDEAKGLYPINGGWALTKHD